MYASKVEAAKDDLPALKEIVSLLRRVRCQEIDAFYTAAGYAYKLEPSADAALGIAKQAVKAKDYDKAIPVSYTHLIMAAGLVAQLSKKKL